MNRHKIEKMGAARFLDWLRAKDWFTRTTIMMMATTTQTMMKVKKNKNNLLYRLLVGLPNKASTDGAQFRTCKIRSSRHVSSNNICMWVIE